MNWFALLGPLLKLLASLAAWLRERALLTAGEARGRAASDAGHARTAAARDARMREIAQHPPTRTDVEKRLEEGSA